MHPSRVPLFLEKSCAAIAGATLAVALASMTAQVFFRYGVGSSLVWSEEVARYALIWSAMIGSAVAYQRGSHIALTLFLDLLPASTARAAHRVVHGIVIVFALFVAWQGAWLTMRNFERNQLSPALQLPIAWIYLAVPVGALLIAGAAAIGLWRGLPSSRNDPNP